MRPSTTTPGQRSYRVVLVDDHEDSRELMEAVLTADGFEVEAVGDAERALEAARERIPDLVLTDLTLPAMSGEELVAELRSSKALAAVPVVAVSGRDVEPSIANLFDRVLLKPVDPQTLTRELRRVLGELAPPPSSRQ